MRDRDKSFELQLYPFLFSTKSLSSSTQSACGWTSNLFSQFSHALDLSTVVLCAAANRDLCPIPVSSSRLPRDICSARTSPETKNTTYVPAATHRAPFSPPTINFFQRSTFCLLSHSSAHESESATLSASRVNAFGPGTCSGRCSKSERSVYGKFR